MKKVANFSFSEAGRYLLVGLASTLVFLLLKMTTFSLLKSGVFSEIISQILTTLFGFFMNRTFVFKSQSKTVAVELATFSSTRFFVMLLAVLLNWYLIDTQPQLLMSFFHIKLKTTVLLLSIFLQALSTVLNYLSAKYLVFRKKS